MDISQLTRLDINSNKLLRDLIHSQDPENFDLIYFIKYWLGYLDSNQGMPVPKTGALPLGYTPK